LVNDVLSPKALIGFLKGSSLEPCAKKSIKL